MKCDLTFRDLSTIRDALISEKIEIESKMKYMRGDKLKWLMEDHDDVCRALEKVRKLLESLK